MAIEKEMKFGKVIVTISCKRCGKEMAKKGQKLRQISPYSWEAHPDTPCECGSLEYKQEIQVV
jgi:hypothetical protein